MTEQQFEVFQECEYLEEWSSCPYCIKYDGETVFETLPLGIAKEVCKKLNEQQELIEELQVSDEMGWKRAEHFEKKCSKELHNKKMYIKRLEYKVQKFKEENEQLREEYAESLADEVKKNGLLNEEINQLRIENMRLKKKGGDEMSEKNCGSCKHLHLDGMFDFWCDENHDWTLFNGNCSDFER